MNPLDFLLGKGKPTPGARPGWPPAPQGQFPSSWGAKKSSATVRPPIGIKGAGRLLGPALAIPDIIEQINEIRNPQDNIITNLQNLGSGVGNLLQGKPYLSGARVGTPGQYYGPAYASEEALGIKSGGPRNYGSGYREDELRAGQQAEDFRPGAGFPGQQSAADRAYQQEKSRVSQLTAQDPELKRYADARKLAVAPGATPEQIQSAEDIGMQIWAAKYGGPGGLASKVKPGQAGYDVIQGTLAGQAAATGLGYQLPQQIMMTPPPGVNVPQGLPAVQSITPTETYGAQGLEVDPEMRKKFQALLDKTAQAQ